jgi:hypothetical protein
MVKSQGVKQANLFVSFTCKNIEETEGQRQSTDITHISEIEFKKIKIHQFRSTMKDKI